MRYVSNSVKGAFCQERSKTRRDRRAAEARGEKVDRQTPRTIEDMKVHNETLLPPEMEEEDEEGRCWRI